MRSNKFTGAMDILIGLADIGIAIFDFNTDMYAWSIVLCFIGLCVTGVGMLLLLEK